jgi:hypothetical protein
MRKIHFVTLMVVVIFFSCKKEVTTVLKKSSGKINNIAVIIDDQLWNGEVGDSIRNKFAAPVIGLPQEEPLFTINQYPVKLMEGFMTDSRAIILIKRAGDNSFEVKKNSFATPQNVFCISGTTAANIIALIQKNAPEMIRIIREAEIEEIRSVNSRSLLQTKKLNEKFKIDLKVPSSYEYVLEDANFVWLKKEIVSGNTSLLLYQLPLNSIENGNNLVANIIKIRDSIGDLYIHGKEPDTDMRTEEAYAPYFFKVSLDGKQAYEMKGTWELKNDFMSGPFINYTVVDKINNRVLVLEGFCYSPSKEKRDLMLELEAVIKSVKVLN